MKRYKIEKAKELYEILAREELASLAPDFVIKFRSELDQKILTHGWVCFSFAKNIFLKAEDVFYKTKTKQIGVNQMGTFGKQLKGGKKLNTKDQFGKNIKDKQKAQEEVGIETLGKGKKKK